MVIMYTSDALLRKNAFGCFKKVIFYVAAYRMFFLFLSFLLSPFPFYFIYLFVIRSKSYFARKGRVENLEKHNTVKGGESL